jgi:hypothetical protein
VKTVRKYFENATKIKYFGTKVIDENYIQVKAHRPIGL